MTKKQFAALGKQLLFALDGYEVQGDLVFRSPITHTLQGLAFERRDDAGSFYLWAFFMPLCIPRTDITLSFGERLGGPSHSWDRENPELVATLVKEVRNQAIPFLSGLETPDDVVGRIRKLRVPQDAFYVHEVIGYLLARDGRVSEALDSLDRMLASLRQGPQPDWVKQVADRAILLQDKLILDPAAARGLLDSWESETLQNFKLERFRRPKGDDSAIHGAEVPHLSTGFSFVRAGESGRCRRHAGAGVTRQPSDAATESTTLRRRS